MRNPYPVHIRKICGYWEYAKYPRIYQSADVNPPISGSITLWETTPGNTETTMNGYVGI